MSNDEYGHTEIPLIPGELYGMRGFSARKDGTLGPLHRSKGYVYSSGINHAKCDDAGVVYQMTIGPATYTITSGSGATELFHTSKNNRVPVKQCTCGFYAYFDTEDDQRSFMSGSSSTHVNGIVRATGKCIVGNLGFRAEKMEIVGLVACTDDMTWRDRAKGLILEVGEGMSKIPFKYIAMFLGIHWTLLILRFFVEQSTVKGVLDFSYMSMMLLLWSFVFVQLVTIAFGTYWMIRADTTSLPSRELSNNIRKQYPDVKFFPSLDEARAHFKISKASDIPQ